MIVAPAGIAISRSACRSLSRPNSWETKLQMRRRIFLASTLLSVSLPKLVVTQIPTRVFRLGWVVTNSAAYSAPFLDAFRGGLADLGLVEGQNLYQIPMKRTHAADRGEFPNALE